MKYTEIILNFLRARHRTGENPTKVYLSSEQIAELLSESIQYLPQDHSVAIYKKNPELKIFGLLIINVDDL